MTDDALDAAIHAAIADLYARSGAPRPSVDRPIAPLGELTGSYSLTWKELPHLTGAAAVAYLRERVPLLDVPERLAHDRLAGFLYASARFGNIFVEQRDRLTRRRFSVAHELGHYTLHVLPYFAAHRDDPDAAPVGIVEALPTDGQGEEGGQLQGRMMLPPFGDADISDWADGVRRTTHDAAPADERLEREANRFAAELLMPADIVAQLVERHGAQFHGADLISRLASDMLVSRAAVELRLHDLGLLTASRPRRHAPGLN